MGLDTAKFIGQLDPASPAPGDPKGQGDDHIRATKAAARQSFPGFPGVILVGGTDTGTTNTYLLNPPTALQEYSKNMGVLWYPSNTNGGASTINISGLGAVAIKRQDGTAVSNGDIMAGQPLLMSWTGTEFRIANVTQQYVNQLVFSGVLPGQVGNAGKALITNGTAASFSNAFGVAMDEAKGADVVAAPTINLSSGAGTGNLVHITGAGVNIGAFTLPSGAERTVVFDAVNTLVASASLILPGAANITTAAGDTAILRGDGTATRAIDYVRANGRAVIEQTPPGWVLLTPAPVVPVAGVTAIDFLNIFSSAYDDYVVVFNGLTINTNGGIGNIVVQLAFNGVVDLSANCAYAVAGQSPLANQSSIELGLLFSYASSASKSDWVSGQITFLGMNETRHSLISSGLVMVRDPNVAVGVKSAQAVGSHVNDVLTSVSGFRLLMQITGTFAATGSIKVYGIRKA